MKTTKTTKNVCEWLDFCHFQLHASEYEAIVPVNLVEEIKQFDSTEDFIFSCGWIDYRYEIEVGSKKYQGGGGGHFVKIGKDFYFVGKVQKPWSGRDCGIKANHSIPTTLDVYTYGEEKPRDQEKLFMQFSVIDKVALPKSKEIADMIVEVGSTIKAMLDKRAMLNGNLVSSSVDIGV
jgi:hypothetical protein